MDGVQRLISSGCDGSAMSFVCSAEMMMPGSMEVDEDYDLVSIGRTKSGKTCHLLV